MSGWVGPRTREALAALSLQAQADPRLPANALGRLQWINAQPGDVDLDHALDQLDQLDRHIPDLAARMRLRVLRDAVGLTQEGLATETGASADAVKSWEAGRRPIPAWLPKYLLLLVQARGRG